MIYEVVGRHEHEDEALGRQRCVHDLEWVHYVSILECYWLPIVEDLKVILRVTA